MDRVIQEKTLIGFCNNCSQSHANCVYGCELLVRDIQGRLDMLPADVFQILASPPSKKSSVDDHIT